MFKTYKCELYLNKFDLSCWRHCKINTFSLIHTQYDGSCSCFSHYLYKKFEENKVVMETILMVVKDAVSPLTGYKRQI